MTPSDFHDTIMRIVNSQYTGTMYGAGQHSFACWQQGSGMPRVWFEDMGPFDSEMQGEEANRRSDHVDKLTEKAQRDFIRGWNDARSLYLVSDVKETTHA